MQSPWLQLKHSGDGTPFLLLDRFTGLRLSLPLDERLVIRFRIEAC